MSEIKGKKEIIRLQDIINDLLTKNIALQNKANEALDTGASSAEKAAKAAESLGESMAQTLTGPLGLNSGLTKSFFELAGSIKEVDNIAIGFGKSLATSLAGTGLSAIEKVTEATLAMAKSTDDALVSFQKQTGAVGTYGLSITNLEASMYSYGISLDEAVDSQVSLINSIRNFKDFAPSSQESMLKLTAVLNEMGVESDMTSQTLGFMINSLGMSSDAAEQATIDMFSLAKALKMPPQQMADSFNKAQPQLAAFGSRANQVFRKLAINAQAANMQVDDILRITEQFDRFDTAAAAVSKLNAALGGPYLSTIRMVTTTDPTERIRMMSEAANRAGKSFDEMEYYERKMIASAMGLQDVNELALVMSNNFDLVSGNVETTQEDIVKLAKQTQQYNSIVDEMSQIFRSFAIALGPVVRGFSKMLDLIGKISGGAIPALIVGVGLLVTAVVAASTAVVGAIAVMVTSATVGTGGFYAIVVAIGIAVSSAIAGLLFITKGLVDLIRKTTPVTDILSKAWERLTKQFNKAGGAMEGIKKGISSILTEDRLEYWLTGISYGLERLADDLIKVDRRMRESGGYEKLGKFIGVATIAIVGIASAIGFLIGFLIDLNDFIKEKLLPTLMIVAPHLGLLMAASEMLGFDTKVTTEAVQKKTVAFENRDSGMADLSSKLDDLTAQISNKAQDVIDINLEWAGDGLEALFKASSDYIEAANQGRNTMSAGFFAARNKLLG